MAEPELAFTYSKYARDWIVIRREGRDWVRVRVATPEDRERLPLYGSPRAEQAQDG